MSIKTIPMPKQMSIDIGDIYEECGELDKKENTTYRRVKCGIFYGNGKDYNYNLCCIRFFIKKALLEYNTTKPIITFNSGVRFCEECSNNLLDDPCMLETIYDLTNEDEDKLSAKLYTVEKDGESVSYILIKNDLLI